ncbi:MAG: hypothetical protein RR540_08930, partial [Oscillospiraceae bacterium]
YGFSDKLGPIVYGNDQNEVFLGRDFSSTPNYSESVASEIDAEIRELIEDAYEKCKDILTEHIDQLHLIAKYLLKYEKIDGKDFEKLMNGELSGEEYEAEKDKADLERAEKDKKAAEEIGKILDVTIDDDASEGEEKASTAENSSNDDTNNTNSSDEEKK